MTDKHPSATSADAIGTALFSNLNLLGQTILTNARIPVPSVESCTSVLNDLCKSEHVGQRKTGDQISAERAELKKNLQANFSRYNALSIKSVGLLGKHLGDVSNILLCAKYLREFEEAKDLEMVEKYKALYIQEKEVLRNKLGDKVFADLMADLMQSSSKNKLHKHFGALFHADSFCEAEFQRIADVANTVHLTNLAKQHMPKKVQMAANMFGKEREYNTVELASKLGHILLPANPAQDNTIYVVCPALEKLAKNPKEALAQLQSKGGEALYENIRAEIEAMNLPPEWKANIKVVGDNIGAAVATEYFSAIQQGLRGDLGPAADIVKKQAAKHVLGKAEELAKKAGLGGGVDALNQLGGAAGLAKHVKGLDFQSVQTSPLLSKEFRGANPKYDEFLTKAKIPQGLGYAGLALGVAQELGLDKVAMKVAGKADQKLRQYHKYRVIRPGLKFAAENALPSAGYVMTGAAIGSAVPGIGTGVGAAIGAGVAVATLLYKGYGLYKERKQMRLEKEARKHGMEIESSDQNLGPLNEPVPHVKFSHQKPHAHKSTLSHASKHELDNSSSSKKRTRPEHEKASHHEPATKRRKSMY